MRLADRLTLFAAASATALLAAPAAACTASATGVAFGAYDTLSPTPDDGVGTIVVDCHPTVAAPIAALGAGQAGSFSPRRMFSGANSLGYNLYTSSAYVVVWGDGSAGTSPQTLTGGTVSGGIRRFTRTVYGRIPARQTVSLGGYADTVIVTIAF